MIMAWFSKEKSGSLEDFRETLKDVLEEITVLEINTMIVDQVSTDKFDVENFFNEIKGNIPIKPTEQPSYAQDGLEEQDGLKKEEEKAEIKQKRYAELKKKISKFDIKFQIIKCKTGNCKVVKCETGKCEIDKCETDECPVKLVNPDAQMTRYFRKLWEAEQSFINGDRVYAQTKLTLDGDLTNRFVQDLFQLTASSDVNPKIDPKTSELILSLHRQSVENGQHQWSGLINTCVDLVKSLIPFRK